MTLFSSIQNDLKCQFYSISSRHFTACLLYCCTTVFFKTYLPQLVTFYFAAAALIIPPHYQTNKGSLTFTALYRKVWITNQEDRSFKRFKSPGSDLTNRSIT